MTRYATMFARCAARNEAGFGAFLMLGDPGPDASLAAIDRLVAGGADFLELGLPFSDPVADGPVIQAAATRALAAGVTTSDAIDLLARVRRRHPDIPIGILTYANLAIARGFDRFVAALAEAGADSLLLADVPSIEAAPFAEATSAAGLDWVMIAAANSPRPTLATIAALSSGYTYVVTRVGVTGADQAAGGNHKPLLDALRSVGAPPPVLGFGISTPADVARAVADGAAGVISGSALVRQLAAGEDLAPLVAELKAATRRSGPAAQVA